MRECYIETVLQVLDFGLTFWCVRVFGSRGEPEPILIVCGSAGETLSDLYERVRETLSLYPPGRSIPKQES